MKDQSKQRYYLKIRSVGKCDETHVPKGTIVYKITNAKHIFETCYCLVGAGQVHKRYLKKSEFDKCYLPISVREIEILVGKKAAASFVKLCQK